MNLEGVLYPNSDTGLCAGCSTGTNWTTGFIQCTPARNTFTVCTVNHGIHIGPLGEAVLHGERKGGRRHIRNAVICPSIVGKTSQARSEVVARAQFITIGIHIGLSTCNIAVVALEAVPLTSQLPVAHGVVGTDQAFFKLVDIGTVIADFIAPIHSESVGSVVDQNIFAGTGRVIACGATELIAQLNSRITEHGGLVGNHILAKYVSDGLLGPANATISHLAVNRQRS